MANKTFHAGNALIALAAAADTATFGAASSGMAALGSVLSLVAGRVPEHKTLAKNAQALFDRQIEKAHLSSDDKQLVRQMMDGLDLNAQDIMACARDPKAIARLCLDRMMAHDHRQTGAQNAFRMVIVPVLSELLADPNITESLRPAFEDAVAQSLQQIGSTAQAIDATTLATQKIVEQMARQVDAMMALQDAPAPDFLPRADQSNRIDASAAEELSDIRAALHAGNLPQAQELLKRALPKAQDRSKDAQALADVHHDDTARLLATQADVFWRDLQRGQALESYGQAMLAARDPILMDELTDIRQRRINYSVHRQADFGAAKSIAELGRNPTFVFDEITFNTLIAKSESYAQARSVFDEMQAAEGVSPDEITYSTLIAKAESYAQARSVFDDMQAAEGVSPNEITFNTLIAKSESYAQARSVFDDMQAAEGVSPNETTYSTLIAKSESYAQARSVFDDMQAAEGVSPNEFTYSTLIAKARVFENAWTMHLQMIAEGHAPGPYSIGGLFRIAKTRDDLDKAMTAARDHDVAIDAHSYSKAIQLQTRFTAAQALYRQALKDGVRIDLHIVTALMSKAPSFGEAFIIAKDHKKSGGEVNEYFYSALIAKCDKHEQRMALIGGMEKEGTLPDAFIYSHIITKCPDVDEKARLYAQMKARGVSPEDGLLDHLRYYGITE